MTPERRVILVVEDSDECAATLEIAIGAIPGVEVRLVPTGEQALQVLASAPVSALVTDVNLPGMDGIELAGRVRGDVSTAGIPILVVSGDSDVTTPARARKAGVTDFFAKPFSPAALRHRLEALLHGH